jgi:flagellar biosynthesis protein FlhF
MKVRRFVGANCRAALREVRETLGSDAVILANRPIPKGVEILAAAANELDELTQTPPRATPAATVAHAVAAATPPARPIAPTPVSSERAEPAPSREASWTEPHVLRTRTKSAASTAAAATGAARPAPQFMSPPASRPEAPRMSLPTAALPAADLAIARPSLIEALPEARATQISDEIRSMRGYMEDQLAAMAWGDRVGRSPQRMRLLQDLIGVGFSPALARQIQDHLPDDFSTPQARAWVQKILAHNLDCGGPRDDVIDRGGVFALVGPTGVGKTTTTAKLAARFAVKYGVDQLALITTDGYRVGAQDQLRIYGRILGIQVHTIQDQASLSSALQHLRQKRLILIDTAGLGQRDARVAEQIAMLSGAQVQRLLVLNSTVQAETLDDTVSAYRSRDYSGCILTKIDEAVRLGPVLDVVIRQRLKIHFVSNGQRVPEDLHYPNVAYLAHRAMRDMHVSKAFELEAGDQPAWLAAVARATLEVTRGEASHV